MVFGYIFTTRCHINGGISPLVLESKWSTGPQLLRDFCKMPLTKRGVSFFAECIITEQTVVTWFLLRVYFHMFNMGVVIKHDYVMLFCNNDDYYSQVLLKECVALLVRIKNNAAGSCICTHKLYSLAYYYTSIVIKNWPLLVPWHRHVYCGYILLSPNIRSWNGQFPLESATHSYDRTSYIDICFSRQPLDVICYLNSFEGNYLRWTIRDALLWWSWMAT